MLCSFVNPKFKQLLLEQNEEKELFFPDIPYKYLEQFINDVYTGLCSSEFVLDINQDLAEVLGMLDGTTYKSENSTGLIILRKSLLLYILPNNMMKKIFSKICI